MGFLAPTALALLTLALPILLMYLLKRRREEVTVSSTLLWHHLIRDVEANAPWQRLRPHILLFLQLLALLALVLAAARPFVAVPTVRGRHLIVVVDTSISMGAHNEEGTSRLDVARQRALVLFDALPAGGRMTLIRGGGNADVRLAQAEERAALERALRTLTPSAPDSDMTAALHLAAALAARDEDAQVILLSDGDIHVEPTARQAVSDIAFTFESVGSPVENSAISSLAVRPQGQGFSLFVQVTHYGRSPVDRRLVVETDNQLFSALDVTLAPGASADYLFDLPPQTRTVHVRLDPADALPADDVAWATAVLPAPRTVRLVSAGNRFLQAALSLLPNVTLVVDPLPAPPPDEPPTLTVLDAGWSGDALPEGNVWLIAPAQSVGTIEVTGVISAPVPVATTADDPILRFVDVSDVAILDAVRSELPGWARPVLVDRLTGAPLLWVGEESGRRVAFLAFDLHRSDLPLRVAFPLLVANLVNELTGPEAPQDVTARVGEPVRLVPPASAQRATVITSEGRPIELTLGSRVPSSFVPTSPGLYTIRWEGVESPPIRVGVSVLNPPESRAGVGVPNLVGRAIAPERGPSRVGQREFWRWAAGLALLALVVEWLIAYRPHLYATTPKARGR
ncbi:MAG: VWA domain-containing protein [Ardenticatenia bacterium]|nr:VWA domain-containing protein [Ardenticatenia bacterium]